MEVIFSNNNKNGKGVVMFTTSYKLSIIATALVASTLNAGQVGALTTFQANTTAKASEVNNNFIVLTDAINDNDTRLNAKQNLILNACSAGYYMQAVNVDGSVVCQPDVDTNTIYSAGIGLTIKDTTINVDTSTIQSRITGSCATDSAIKSIAADGSVACEADTDTITHVGIEFNYVNDDIVLPENRDAVSLASLNISVPEAGYIHVTAKGMYIGSHFTDHNDIGVYAGITENDTDTYVSTQNTESSFVYHFSSQSLPSGFDVENLFTQRTVYVSTGGSYNYYFRASRSSTTTTNVQKIVQPNITAIFVPNRY